MEDSRFAALPEPPYYAVIFSSVQQPRDPAYDAMAARMVELARSQSGFLGIESCRDADGFGITVSYWRGADDIARWKADAEHAQAQALGRARWYPAFELRVAKVERAYGKPRAARIDA